MVTDVEEIIFSPPTAIPADYAKLQREIGSIAEDACGMCSRIGRSFGSHLGRLHGAWSYSPHDPRWDRCCCWDS